VIAQIFLGGHRSPQSPSAYVTDTDIGRLKAVIDCRQQGFLEITNIVNYIGNHDHDRMLVELGTVLMLVSVNRNYFY
jgi:hypothetical protein